MEFRTVVNLPHPPFELQPCQRMLFVGSCFADSIGRRFAEEKFRTVVNPFGVMYNPVSILHTVERIEECFDTVVLTLGTHHVYIEKATGEIVDNCCKRPQRLFEERELTITECTDALCRSAEILLSRNPSTHIIITVSPIRYAKYGYHGSQLSKSTLLLAADAFIRAYADTAYYFPAYEIVNDELRDYRFYKPDMLHPNEQAVEYIWERLVETGFSGQAREFLREWSPVKAALAHRPFHPESEEYQAFIADARRKESKLMAKYGISEQTTE